MDEHPKRNAERPRRRGRWARVAAAGLAAALVAVVAGCGSGSDPAPGDRSAATTGSDGDDAAADGDVAMPDTGSTWLDLLHHVPDTPEHRAFLVMGDVARAAQVRGVEMPAEDEAAYPVAGYYSALSGISEPPRTELPRTMWMDQLDRDDEIRQELGFSFAEVDAYLSVGAPPEAITVLLGRFDREAIDAALAASAWVDDQEDVEYEGVTYHRWGDDGENDIERISAARPLGQGGRLWASDDRIVWTVTDAAMEAAISAATGQDSLADDETFRTLAESLDHPSVFAAVLTDDIIDGTDPEAMLSFPDPEEVAAYEEDLAAGRQVLLQGVEAYGSAWGMDDDEAVAVLALFSATDEDAEANVDLLQARLEIDSPITRQPHGEGLAATDAGADGPVTSIWFEGERAGGFILSGLLRREGLIAVG